MEAQAKKQEELNLYADFKADIQSAKTKYLIDGEEASTWEIGRAHV